MAFFAETWAYLPPPMGCIHCPGRRALLWVNATDHPPLGRNPHPVSPFPASISSSPGPYSLVCLRGQWGLCLLWEKGACGQGPLGIEGPDPPRPRPASPLLDFTASSSLSPGTPIFYRPCPIHPSMLGPKNHLLPRDPLSSRGVSPWSQLPQVEASSASRKAVRRLLRSSYAAPQPAKSRQTCTSPCRGLRRAPRGRGARRGVSRTRSPSPFPHDRGRGVAAAPPLPHPVHPPFGGRSLSLDPPAPPWNRHLALGRTVAATCAPQNGALGASAPVWRWRGAGGLEMSAERHLRSSPTSSREGLRPPRHNKTPGAQPEGASSRRPLGLGWRPPSKMS